MRGSAFLTWQIKRVPVLPWLYHFPLPFLQVLSRYDQTPDFIGTDVCSMPWTPSGWSMAWPFCCDPWPPWMQFWSSSPAFRLRLVPVTRMTTGIDSLPQTLRETISRILVLRPGIPCFIVLHKCCVFYELKARPSPKQNDYDSFIAIFALLRWSGTEPALSPRYACIGVGVVRGL